MKRIAILTAMILGCACAWSQAPTKMGPISTPSVQTPSGGSSSDCFKTDGSIGTCGSGSTPGGTTGARQFNNNGALAGDVYTLDASGCSGADAGAKIQTCLSGAGFGAIVSTDALGTSMTSANNITVPTYITLHLNGTLTFASGKNLVLASYAKLTGTSIYTASIVGNLNGPVLDGTAGNVTVDGVSVTNNDTSDAGATAATFTLHQNFVGLQQGFQASGGGTHSLVVNPGYYDHFGTIIASNGIYINGANAIIFDYFHSGSLGTCIAIDNTNGFYFNYIDCESSTTKEMDFGELVSGPVNGTINGGYVEPGYDAGDVYFGTNDTGGVVVNNNVTYWGYGTGCGPSGVVCSANLLTLGSTPSNATGLYPINYNGLDYGLELKTDFGLLEIKGNDGDVALWATGGNHLAAVGNNTTGGHIDMQVGSLSIASLGNLDTGPVVIPNTATGYHGTAGTKVQLSDGMGATGDYAQFTSDGSLTDGGAILKPPVIFSHAGTQLAACASGTIGTSWVSDATSLTPGTAYSVSAGAGAITVQVECTHSGSSYSWQTM